MGAENRSYRILILALATWGGVGFLPYMPGTWGTLAALPLWYHLALTGPWGYGLGVAAPGHPGPLGGGPRPGDFGADGPPGHRGGRSGGPFNHPGRRPPDLEVHAALGLVIFRTLDILKPFPIRWFQEGGKGGLEVMADDIAAGVIGRVVLEVVMIFWGRG